MWVFLGLFAFERLHVMIFCWENRQKRWQSERGTAKLKIIKITEYSIIYSVLCAKCTSQMSAIEWTIDFMGSTVKLQVNPMICHKTGVSGRIAHGRGIERNHFPPFWIHTIISNELKWCWFCWNSSTLINAVAHVQRTHLHNIERVWKYEANKAINFQNIY